MKCGFLCGMVWVEKTRIETGGSDGLGAVRVTSSAERSDSWALLFCSCASLRNRYSSAFSNHSVDLSTTCR